MDERISDMKKKIQKRIKLNMMMIFVFIIVLMLSLQNRSDQDFIRGYQNGVASGLILGSILNLIKNIYFQTSNQRLLTRYIKEHDERNIFLRDKVGFNIFRIEAIALLGISDIVPLFYANCHDLLIGFIASIYILAFIRVVMYIYYNQKF